jgi:hypothetical protein
MAWTDQCQLAFKASAERFIAHGEGMRATLRKLALESGIPYPHESRPRRKNK